MKIRVLLGILVVGAAGCNASDDAQQTVYYGGPILTMTGAEPTYVEALVQREGEIVFVGDRADALNFAGEAEEVDLEGRTLMPGFIDSHGHVTALGLSLAVANLAAPPYGEADTFEGVKKALREYIEEENIPEETWVMGLGYDTSILPGHPTRDVLDEVSIEHPILIVHSSGHIGVVNSKALELSGITGDSENPPGGVIQRLANGEPNGILEETAMFGVLLAVPQPPEEELLNRIDAALELYASFGVTTVQDGRTTPADLALLEAAASEGRLYLDVISYPAIELISDEWQPDFDKYREYSSNLKIGGVKLSLDGSMPGKTAYVTEPYLVPPPGQESTYVGYPAFSDVQVDAFVQKAWDEKWQILIHCNADAAGDQMLNALKRIGNTAPYDWRPVMIHAQAAREDQLDDMQELNVIPSFEMTHTFLFGDYYVSSVFGKERGDRSNPAGSAFRRGMPFTFHTDSPVVVPDVLMAAWAGVNRLTRSDTEIGPDQKVSPYEAMKALTTYAAYQNFEEDTKGSLEVGKVADLVILSDNPLTVDPKTIHEIEVVETIKDGTTVYRAN